MVLDVTPVFKKRETPYTKETIGQSVSFEKLMQKQITYVVIGEVLVYS